MSDLETTRPIIEVHNLTKSFGEVPVLRGISFQVRRGSIFALLGSNGAGKTTTVRILSTLLRPDGGGATIDGAPLTDRAAVRARISLTGQFAAVDEALTGRQNLRLICALRGLGRRPELIERLLADFGLVEAADRKAATYSGGMRRKLDIAMSLIGDPAVLFLDEPTTGLDPQSRQVLWQKIEGLAAAGTTVFLTTQYLEEAQRLADRVVILDGGAIAAEGSVAEITAQADSLESAFLALVDTQEASR